MESLKASVYGWLAGRADRKERTRENFHFYQLDGIHFILPNIAVPWWDRVVSGVKIRKSKVHCMFLSRFVISAPGGGST